MNNISFCILTAKNLKLYLKLLLKSLLCNTQITLHLILIIVDSDNQDTCLYLKLYRLGKDNIRVFKNTSQYMLGIRNVSILFNTAINNIVCYLHSDMVVGNDFDKHILQSLKSDKDIVCATRVEPPLHPLSPLKIIKSFGTAPELFDLNKFNKYIINLQQDNKTDTNGHFAPFAMYKDTYFNTMGGFDTEFRCSREDSDFILRTKLSGLNHIQS